MTKTFVNCWISLVVMFSLPLQAAESVWMKNNRASIGIGAFFLKEDTDVRFSSGTGGIGTRFSFQDDLGFDEDDNVARLVGHYRFNPRHRINFGYFKLSQDATAVLLRNIIYEDRVFTAGSTIKSELDFAVLKVLYTYSFFQNTKIDLGVSMGVHIYEFDSKIVSRTAGFKEESDGTAPFPVVGLRFQWRFKPKLSFAASLDYFEIDEGDTEGKVFDILLALEHQTWKNTSLGIGYNVVTIEAEKKDDNDDLNWDYDGFFVYARFHF